MNYGRDICVLQTHYLAFFQYGECAKAISKWQSFKECHQNASKLSAPKWTKFIYFQHEESDTDKGDLFG